MVQESDVVACRLLDTCVGVDHNAAVAGKLDATDALVVGTCRKGGHRVPFGRGVHKQQFPVVIALGLHRFQQLAQVDPISLVARHHNAHERSIGKGRRSDTLARQIARLCAMPLKPTSISCVVCTRVLHTVPAVVDHAVVQATIHGAKPALDPLCGIAHDRDKISYILRHLNTQIRFIDAASVLLRNIDLRFKHMHGNIDGIHMRIEDLELRRALGVSRPGNLIAPHRADVCRQIANGIDLVAAAVFATLRIADKRAQRRLCFVVNLGFQFGHAAIETNRAQPLATGCKNGIHRRAIQKRKHQNGELALVIGNRRA